MFITSYLIGLAAFILSKLAIDWKKEKKRVFKAYASGNAKAPSQKLAPVYQKLFERLGLASKYNQPLSILAGLHLASLWVAVILKLNQIAAGMASIIIPVAIVYVATLYFRRQRSALEEQVEPLLTSIASSLYGNPAIVNALREAKENAEQPMERELARVLTEIDNGSDINSALERFSGRINNEVIELAVDGILICRETGGNLANLLESLSSVARTRANLKGRIKAVTAQQKTTATFVAVIPIIFVLITEAISPTYQEHLSSPSGMAAAAYALISVFIGFIWLNKMTNILSVR